MRIDIYSLCSTIGFGLAIDENRSLFYTPIYGGESGVLYRVLEQNQALECLRPGKGG